MRPGPFFTNVFLISALLLLPACAPSVQRPVPTTSAIPPAEVPGAALTATAAAPLDRMVDVGGYHLRIICTGQGTPTVVVESASEAALESGNWLAVRYGVEKTTRICIYDRAGLGSSEAPPARPRTSHDLADDLLKLLIHASVPEPYVLVGQDLGAFHARIFASQYPERVAGMVLVDPLHPDYESATLAALPPESPDEPEVLGFMRQGLWPDPASGEGVDYAASAEQVRRAGSLGDLPLVVLTRRARWFFVYPDTPPDVLARMEEVWSALQADLADLSSNSTHVIAISAGQSAAVDEDQQIVDAILEVVAQAR